MNQPINVGFGVDVYEGDALQAQGDVLMLKDWRNTSRGLDSLVYNRLVATDHPLPLLKAGEFHLIDSSAVMGVSQVLMIGPSHRPIKTYTHIRELAYDMLALLKQAAPETEHAITNVQGTNIGFDETEALRAMLLGFNDAYEANEYPPNLQLITFAEKAMARAELMRIAIDEFLPKTTVLGEIAKASDDIANIIGEGTLSEQAKQPEATESTPHIFVAMPFSEAYDDQYYLAIYPAVHDVDHLCVRLDQLESAFTGNIIEAIKDRVDNASLVIALLDSANPNVYLEIGYAWGRGIPTVLIAHESEGGDGMPFDVRGERILHYSHIYKLKRDLTNELKMLIKKLNG